ncbi:MAG: DNA topoisomerase IB [Actinomycetota bacterium]|nr:DNA topoisomerase IB [Actinomycetota bacterium]
MPPRLRRVNCGGPGLMRKRQGRGFRYVDAGGNVVTDPATRARIEALVIPPAWQDVWICPIGNGHIQATGTDAAGRRQYLYHQVWREKRDLEKFDRMLDFAERLPAMREQVMATLQTPGLTKDRVLAAAVRLLDLGFFRIGGEAYAEANNTYGLATIRREHVSIAGGVVTFDYIAKSGKQRVQHVADDAVLKVIRALQARKGGGEELLAYRTRAGWVDIKSADINSYLATLTGGEVTAKDFRTWNATVLAAVGLAVSRHAPNSESGRKRAVSRAVKEVADYLGNTPAVCRASYIDPRLIDHYEQGRRTIEPVLDELGADAEFGTLATQGATEQAVLELLRGPKKAAAAEARAAATKKRLRKAG